MFGNDEPFGRDARLPVVDDARLDRGGDSIVQVRAGHHDERVASAEFQHHFLDVLRGGDAAVDAGFFASGEGRGSDAPIRKNAVHLAGTNEQRLESALRKTGAQENLLDLQRALGNIRSMLQQTDVSRH